MPNNLEFCFLKKGVSLEKNILGFFYFSASKKSFSTLIVWEKELYLVFSWSCRHFSTLIFFFWLECFFKRKKNFNVPYLTKKKRLTYIWRKARWSSKKLAEKKETTKHTFLQLFFVGLKASWVVKKIFLNLIKLFFFDLQHLWKFLGCFMN